ncbi:hypothetical protein Sango_0296900 [Sesamum angolense]|uniref:FLZ-type domain-containing protein n=1 Tax=Sesamum angolense TaxID=2727404 RepID=A0AAE1X9D5_9LAMI|nr:hypothetical protein Sango_0296900 [Sesamum angolense]
MPVKRSRVGSSTSHLETPLPTAASTVSPAKVMRTDATAEPSRPKILAVASSVDIGQSNQLEIGGFLERCHYCKKRIAQNSEVFMYSNLCAFCSAECRDFQISLDQSAEQWPEKHKDKLVQGQGFYNVKGHSEQDHPGFRLEADNCEFVISPDKGSFFLE